MKIKLLLIISITSIICCLLLIFTSCANDPFVIQNNNESYHQITQLIWSDSGFTTVQTGAGWTLWDLSAFLPSGTKAINVNVQCEDVGFGFIGVKPISSTINPNYVTNSWHGFNIISECDSTNKFYVYDLTNLHYIQYIVVGYWK